MLSTYPPLEATHPIARGRWRGVTIQYSGTPALPSRVEEDWGRPRMGADLQEGRVEEIDFEGNLAVMGLFVRSGTNLDVVTSPEGMWRDDDGAGTGTAWQTTAIVDPLGHTIETHAYCL
jgi:hypothetical protein